jgi:4,5-dihydroxyphthalate decarboxylase
MPKLALTLACWDYDRTRPLMDGRVQVEGIDLNWICLRPVENFERQIRNHEFDVSEFSLSYLTFLRSRGDWEYIGIPVFPSRTFRHSCIYVNTSAGIQRPQDLIGKRVGVPHYPMTAAVWIRQLLMSDYQMRPEQLKWFYAGAPLFSWNPPSSLALTRIAAGKSLDGMLEEGELDALISVEKPASFLQGSPNVERLFKDYRAIEEEYYARTKLFPIMHTLIVRREIQQKHPWVAMSLFKAFQQAKNLCYRDLLETDAPKYTLPWQGAEAERTEQLMGKDFWPYGIEKNRHVIETLVRSSCEQGLAAREIPVQELFARETHELN